MHPSRRIRALTANLHNAFLQIGPIREQICFFLRETAPAHQTESILGSWCMAAHDVDRVVSSSALKSWTAAVSGDLALDSNLRQSLSSFLQRTILDPNGVYMYLNPPAPAVPTAAQKKGSGRAAAPPPPPRREDPESGTRSKADELEESEQDRKARLRVGAIGAIKWVLGVYSSFLPTPSNVF